MVVESKGIDGIGEVDGQRFVAIKFASRVDQSLGKVAENTPVARLVGIGERGAGDVTTRAHVIELRLLRPQAGFDIAQTFAVSELSKGQAEELIAARKSLDVVISSIAIDTGLKFVPWEKVHELRKDSSSRIHGPPLTRAEKRQNDAKLGILD